MKMKRGILLTPGKRIRRLRVQNDLDQKNLADELSYKTYTTISKWETDKSLPPGRELRKLAAFFGVSIDYILGLDELINPKRLPPVSSTNGLVFYESIEEALCGNNQQVIDAPQLILKEKKEHYFVLKVQTDSVNQLIPPASNIVILDFSVAEDQSLSTGDIIVVRVNDTYRILTLRKTDFMVYLEPASFLEGFESFTLTTDEFYNLHLVGKVVASYQVFN